MNQIYNDSDYKKLFLEASRNMQTNQSVASTRGHLGAPMGNEIWKTNLQKAYETFLKSQQTNNKNANSTVITNKYIHQQGKLYLTFALKKCYISVNISLVVLLNWFLNFVLSFRFKTI